MGLVLLAAQDQRLNLRRKLVGMPVRAPRSIGQPVQADIVVARQDLVAGLAGDTELPAQARHLLAIQQPGYELQTLIHGFTRLPGHLALLAKGPIV
jgi:hypothetical protein